MGSDTYGELSDEAQNGLVYRAVADTRLRIGLLAASSQVESVQNKLAAGETLNVATSYPRAAKRSSGALGCAVRIVATLSGSVEAAPTVYPGVDGVIEIVDSGDTAKQNDLMSVRDNLEAVTIGAVWRERAPTIRTPSFDGAGLLAAIDAIERRVAEAAAGQRDSYTQRLAGDPNKLGKKFGEEGAEFLMALGGGDIAAIEAESADMLYVLTTAIAVSGGSLLGALALFASRNTA